ncbi:MAG TPA: UDP-N-acetylmuramoyl-tripeptide--D-alanyl-D-alanine ligase [Verrucomicrobiota bacterium]|nr:UDP-N-acetylmuramoyl-tripeptide--D-alanyl-D-alanine ligase [Verrucomicrobiota bacterium]HNU52757.1 UDP-N-acetylmuramoyl-tripeptide--D-alanyl-D-alanine ligase [Verrucomicrobiota bacterium]
MEPRSLEFVARAAGGEIRNAPPGLVVHGLDIDSRTVAAGRLFLALRGDRFDGHDFLRAARKAGAAAVLIERRRVSDLPANCPAILVDDSRHALGAIAREYRSAFSIPVVAVGGSNGKTTTKDLVASVLRTRGPVQASPASYNNDIGVPLTLLGLETQQHAGVVELGTNHPGELLRLLEIARPTHAVLTCLGREHLEFFGDLEGVIREEGWLAEQLPPRGTLVVHGDDPAVEPVLRRTSARIVRTGWSPDASWQALSATLTEHGTSFTVRAPTPELSGTYTLQHLGRHQVANALLALALGAELGLNASALRQGLAAVSPATHRLQLHQVAGIRILDDTYNANADSMRAALDTLRALPIPARRIAVLGAMAELGPHSPAAHAEVGRHAAAIGIDQLVTVGPHAADIADAARAAGFRNVETHPDALAAADRLAPSLRPGDLVLVKASRSARLEQVVEALLRALRSAPSTPTPACSTT